MMNIIIAKKKNQCKKIFLETHVIGAYGGCVWREWGDPGIISNLVSSCPIVPPSQNGEFSLIPSKCTCVAMKFIDVGEGRSGGPLPPGFGEEK